MSNPKWDSLPPSEKIYLALAELHWTESNGDAPSSAVIMWLEEMSLGFLSLCPRCKLRKFQHRLRCPFSLFYRPWLRRFAEKKGRLTLDARNQMLFPFPQEKHELERAKQPADEQISVEKD